jgi:hypothetical protein
MSEEPNNKRFSEWVEVDCNECQRYWDNSCDGCKDTLKGSKMPCNSFLATRSVIIPQEIKALKKDIKWLKTALTILTGIVLLMAISDVIGGW